MGFVGDMRFALRSLLKTPGFTLAAVTALGLGIGANTAIFSILDAVLFQSLQFPARDRIVMLWETAPKLGGERGSTSLASVFDWTARTDLFDAVGGYYPVDANLTGVEEPTRLNGVATTAGLFSALGAQPALGRTFAVEEDRSGAGEVAVLSHGTWKVYFASDPEVIGRVASINGKAHTIIGVMPQSFDFPPGTELFVPTAATPDALAERGHRRARTVARLKDGVTPAAAQAALSAMAAESAQKFPESMSHREYLVGTLEDGYLDAARGGLLAVAGAVVFVLLIACANVANLLLVRAAIRRRELAVRAALGAGRSRLIRQLLAESLLLALAGAAVGTLLAMWGMDLLAGATRWMSGLAGWKDIGVDLRVLGFSLALSVVTALLFGVLPAISASRPDLSEALKDGAKGSGGGSRLRSSLVIAEIALALVLLTGAGLMMKSFEKALSAPFGFDPDGVVTLKVGLSPERFQQPADRVRYVQAALQRLRSIPGAVEVAATSRAPMSPGNRTSAIEILGRAPPPRGEEPVVENRVVAGAMFELLKIPLLAGRTLKDSDHATAPLVAVVSQDLARKQFGEPQAAIGQRFDYGNGPVEIVGVVGDVLRVGGGKPKPAMSAFYVPYAQNPEHGMTLLVRAEQDAAALIPTLRAELTALDAHQPAYAIRTYEDALLEAYTPLRLSSIMLAVFAVVAAILAAVGIYGVMAYSVAQRTREIGVRVALGAERSTILKLVLGDAGKIAAWGIGIGALAALGLTQLMRGLLYDVSPSDPTVFLLISGAVLVIALFASWVPARRAASVAPMVALRSE